MEGQLLAQNLKVDITRPDFVASVDDTRRLVNYVEALEKALADLLRVTYSACPVSPD